MTREWLIAIIRWSWIIFLVVWFLTALTAKRTRTAESFLDQLTYRGITVLGALFVFDRHWLERFLDAPILPWDEWLLRIGAVLTVTGILFAFWARFHLGRNWSGNVTIKTDHELIRTGPYARIRHPIYTGILIAILGACIATDTWRTMVGFALIILGFWLKARREEAVLAKEFGPKFDEHRQLTGMFLPRLS
ncbi:MAG TPA: isoprenylcysteine carboxylmethyltransferase family protein [Gemmatimonadaceae bacterium]|nr:isoprenylcysteine carboxylmethyltransferase family protein [Gemmatimonadaceae bacterium]